MEGKFSMKSPRHRVCSSITTSSVTSATSSASATSTPIRDTNINHIVLLGLPGAGKQSILKSFTKKKISKFNAHPGLEIMTCYTKILENKMSIWSIKDYERGKELRGILKELLINEGVGGIIFVLDSTDKAHFDDVRKLAIMLMKLVKIPFLFLATKQDEWDALFSYEILRKMHLSQIKDHTWSLHPCSVQLGDGIKLPFEWLILRMKRKSLLLEIGSSVKTGLKCMICLDNCEQNEIISRLDCEHIFHENCIKKWRHLKNTCPICRNEVFSCIQFMESNISSPNFPLRKQSSLTQEVSIINATNENSNISNNNNINMNNAITAGNGIE